MLDFRLRFSLVSVSISTGGVHGAGEQAERLRRAAVGQGARQRRAERYTERRRRRLRRPLSTERRTTATTAGHRLQGEEGTCMSRRIIIT